MILVIEPDTMWQRSLEDTLKSIIDVTVVSSGREAVRLAPSLGQVAVVMELRLPDMHWKDLYLELLGRASYTLAVTHEDEFDTVSELLNRGFSGYFYKPTLNFSEFQRSVENLIP